MAELRLRNVTKSFGDTSVIRGVDLEVRNGEFMVFVGPSGCGKSTLLRLIAGLEMVTDGQVQIDGQDVTRLPASDRGLAMVFQSYALYPHMSVRQNMGFALENMRLPKAEVTARVERAAQMLQLAPYLDRKPRALSGGQRQRVAIGRAIVRDPKIFLFDEPLSNLDAELRVATRKELAALHAEIGGTMIYVTHDQVEAMTLADRIVVLRGGLIEQVGTPLELYNNPANLFVAGFIGSPKMNALPARVARAGSGGALAVEGREIRLDLPGGLREGEPVTFGVRPEHLEPTGEGGDLEAHVDLLEQLGSETYLYASAPGLPQICVRQEGQLGLARGDTVRLRARRDAIHLFNSEGLALRAMQGTGHLA
ncbi:Maltose/maltodextrin transport ATP-binding protein malK (plasmid) [Roseomonas mucosa]|uniref:Maltose/maltodextrin import ATP-binding protein MalK n=1 Tax=Roseomonas mucosa TaxID=207340 RepID=A0A1S8DAN1_9PROT|nr:MULTISPECIES: sn-glycerol-3-phosphate ABC transporter ATP-binding protein UgpC [Roseomonas]MBS5903905.1 sn-glycerol-3-phosphate ABC transporter ATP-binding protein UgpC [Acetobacteraceae bacterium]MCG7350540.1 sn-glycerol-3-phosphate ABC transporter ATP-binding protein UgpC [Roseomonas mucosa]MCG7355776.1 sn-glycerol-3-phosphate ABC transporter ATP-binding protein UgpC [Roseomonas mucosa]MDT8290469.1 sn-glycerol-3-phosphate ABC transporter ATP-binding protein UgpC [Roseomonas mucosa]MDT8295